MNLPQVISCSYNFLLPAVCAKYISLCLILHRLFSFPVFCALIRYIHYYCHKHFINSWLCRMLSNDQHYYAYVSTRYVILLTAKQQETVKSRMRFGSPFI